MEKQMRPSYRFYIKVCFKGRTAQDSDVFDFIYGNDNDRPCTSYISLYRDSVIVDNRKAFTAGLKNIIATGSHAPKYFEWINDSYERFMEHSEKDRMDILFMLSDENKMEIDRTVIEACTTRKFSRITPMPYIGVSDTTNMISILRTYVDDIGLITEDPTNPISGWALYTTDGISFSNQDASYFDSLSSLYTKAMEKCQIIFIDTEAIDWEDESGVLSVTEKLFYTTHRQKSPVRVLY